MDKSHLIPQAEKMFIREHRTGQEIAEALGLHPSTVSRWKDAYKWDERRRDLQASVQTISEKLMHLLAKDVEKLENADGLDPATWDKINKAVKSIKSLDKEVDILGNTIIVMEHLITYLGMKHGALQRQFQEVLPDFLIYMRETFKGQ